MKKDTASPWAFLGVFLLIFFFSATFLYIIDFVPEAPEQNNSGLSETVDAYGFEAPVRIRIARIGVDTSINNPQSVSLETLDNALLSGAVRYPGTASLGQKATMFLFGHQSYLPVVRNQAFKAFNDLQQLEQGDVISVYSSDAEYQYKVASVTKVRADDALIDVAGNEQKLVLSTCNSFGDPGERYVVEAEYVTKIAI